MALNFWQCDEPGCTVTATGTGGALGLHAIGWEFWPSIRASSKLFCPSHRVEKTPCRDEGNNHGKPCSLCAGDEEAAMIQHALRHHSEDLRAWWAATKLAGGEPR